MKKYLIAMAVTAVCVVAIADTKARIEELDEISANTPAQVEMKKNAPKSTGEGVQEKIDNIQTQKQLDNQKFDNMINKSAAQTPSQTGSSSTTRPSIPTYPQMP